MELLLRLYEGNKIKSETSIYQLEYTDEIRNQNSKGILVYEGLELNVLERNVNLNKKQVPFTFFPGKLSWTGIYSSTDI